MFRVYLVTSGSGVRAGLVEAIAGALAGFPPGAAAVQLREKASSGGALYELARALVPICRARGAPLLVNGRADVALAAGAAGVHLPEDGLPIAAARALLGPDAILGKSCHAEEGLRAAADEGATFAVYGPVWATPGKGAPIGLAAFARALAHAKLPVFALGGVEAGSARAALDAGASGLACSRAVLGAADPRAAAERLWAAMEAA